MARSEAFLDWSPMHEKHTTNGPGTLQLDLSVDDDYASIQAPVAQLAERRISNSKCAGSNPAGGAKDQVVAAHPRGSAPKGMNLFTFPDRTRPRCSAHVTVNQLSTDCIERGRFQRTRMPGPAALILDWCCGLPVALGFLWWPCGLKSTYTDGIGKDAHGQLGFEEASDTEDIRSCQAMIRA